MMSNSIGQIMSASSEHSQLITKTLVVGHVPTPGIYWKLLLHWLLEMSIGSFLTLGMRLCIHFDCLVAGLQVS